MPRVGRCGSIRRRTGKIATVIEHEGRRVAAIVHDAELAEERELVQTVGAAAALTLENERLDAELRAQRRRAARLARAHRRTRATTERRRLERDLHDGAQQRLMALGINLRLARDRIDERPAGGGRAARRVACKS